MNTYEKCKRIRSMILNRASEVMVYSTWSDQYAVKQLRNFPEDLMGMKGGETLFGIQPSHLQ